MLMFFSDNPFYSSQVKFPTNDSPVPLSICDDPHFRFFDKCIGAVDGTHIRALSSLTDQMFMRNQKGYISQNCLFICDFDPLFIYSLCGFDGSAADAAMWNDVRHLAQFHLSAGS